MKSSTIFTVLSAFLLAAFGSAFVVAPTHKTGISTQIHSTALSMSDEKKTGVVKWFNTGKGYGFIVPDDGTSDVFVHQTEIKAQGFRSLADGEPVEFTEAKEENGRVKAIKVTGPGGSDVQGAPFQRRDDGYDQY